MDFERELTGKIVDCAIRVHRTLGPGLLESAYAACLIHALRACGLKVSAETPIPVEFDGVTVETGFRADLVVEGRVLVELKSVEQLHSLHEAQILTYLKLSGIKVGLLINFNVPRLQHGIRRYVR
jgi:GxxExxY protein